MIFAAAGKKDMSPIQEESCDLESRDLNKNQEVLFKPSARKLEVEKAPHDDVFDDGETWDFGESEVDVLNHEPPEEDVDKPSKLLGQLFPG